MIAYLDGTILEKESDSIVVLIGGVGLRVYATQNYLLSIESGQRVRLHTHLIVREDLLALYGFDTQEEVRYFSLLMGVSGVGPRLALNILSSAGVDTIRRAVVQEQPDFLSRVPGVGKKTAQKIILQLQGKISGTGEGQDFQAYQPVDFEVIEALTALGYSIIQAQTAVQSIPKDTPDTVEDKLRMALQSLA